MNLRIIDPNISLSSPSMKGVVRSLPALRAAGFSIELWCWTCDKDLTADQVVRLPRVGNLPLINYYFFSLWVRLRRFWMERICHDSRPDLIFSVAGYEPSCDVALVQFSPFDWDYRQRLLGRHNLRDHIEWFSNLLGLVWMRGFLRGTTAKLVLSVSEAVASDLRKENPALKIGILPNSYDAARFHPAIRQIHRETVRRELGYMENETVFAFVSAGHYRRKGFFLAVEALAKLRDRGHHCRFLVVGGRPKRLRELQIQLAHTFPAWQEWMTFTGMIPDVERYFAAADGFLFPSYSEAFALVEVEAAACGLPLFLTPHHGSEMILDDGVNGRQIPFNPEGIAHILEEFVTEAWQPTAGGGRQGLSNTEYAETLTRFLLDLA